MDWRVFDPKDPIKRQRFIMNHPLKNFWMWAYGVSTGPRAGKHRVILMGVGAAFLGATSIFLAMRTEVRCC
jgi:hypothetical protein